MTFNIKGMHSNFCLSILLCMLTLVSHAQNDQTPLINIGDMAPPMRLREWLKGATIEKFGKGKVYVIEFWATWCKPCKAAMPHLSALAEQYRDSVTVIGIDIYENKNITIEKIRHFVDSMDCRMNYNVAIPDSNFIETDWLLATGVKNQGIPVSFVVNRDGRLAWIGHPKDLNKILPQIVNNTWDIKDALSKRKSALYLRGMDDSLNDVLSKYKDYDWIKPGRIGQPDSMLIAINKIIRNEPKLTYATFIVYNTFVSLLKTNQQKAVVYGRLALVNPSYDDEPAYDMIIGAIETYGIKLKLSSEIYYLGAEACQQEINYINTNYPELVDMGKRYHRMAAWYWRAKNKTKAINAERKAIVFLKNQAEFSKIKLAEYESNLRKYRFEKINNAIF